MYQVVASPALFPCGHEGVAVVALMLACGPCHDMGAYQLRQLLMGGVAVPHASLSDGFLTLLQLKCVGVPGYVCGAFLVAVDVGVVHRRHALCVLCRSATHACVRPVIMHNVDV